MTDVMFNFAKFAKEFKEQPKRIVILGGSGSGKTVFGNNLTTTVVQYCRMPVLVGDPKYEKKFKCIISSYKCIRRKRRIFSF